MTIIGRRLFAMILVSLAAMLSSAPLAAQEVKLWTGDVVVDEWNNAQLSGTLRPMEIAAARNGTFSGKVVVESAAAIKGLKATVTELKNGEATIGPERLQIRYAVTWDAKIPPGPDILAEAAPATVPMGRARALAPVWLTVRVPADAKVGIYSGEMTVQAEGLAATKVPVKVDVQNWTLPDSQDYRTWLDLIQSPDTLAVEYGVPLWSEKHWQLVDRSFDIIGGSGSRSLYIPLICRTNFGNEQSMVRWIKKGDGYEQDYQVLNRYLESAVKHMGKPKLVVLQVWDICMSRRSMQRSMWGGEAGKETREGREALLGKGPRVTALDPSSGKTEMIFLPRYEEAGAVELWKPVFAEIRKRLEKHGLMDVTMIGMLNDLGPDKEEVTALLQIYGGLPWASHSHPNPLKGKTSGAKLLHGIADIGYAAHVYALGYHVNPQVGERQYGWRKPVLTAHFPRGGGLNAISSLEIRHMPMFNITGTQRGTGRIGADMWRIAQEPKAPRSIQVHDRYPENNWRNLDLDSWLLAPGPEGALATVRYENLREGMQEAEARIFIEDALLDKTKRAGLGEDLAKRCQALLDEHQKAMWKTIWNNDEDLARVGPALNGRNPTESFWKALEASGKKMGAYYDGPSRALRAAEEKAGQAWWFQSGWQARNKQIFTLAGEVAEKLGK